MNNAALSLVEFVIALSVLLFLHESGHYLSGRLFGIVAEEFGFGYPPKLIKLFNFAGTDFTLNLIPFDGKLEQRNYYEHRIPQAHLYQRISK